MLYENEYQFTFSIIIAIYNTEEYLREAIDSVLNQTLDFERDVQLILVDDGSEDNSLDICLEYQERFPNNIVVLSQENQGQASARNNGLNYAKGKYVNFLDSDDYLSPDALERVKSFFNLNFELIDVIALKIMEFGRKNKGHFLNFKFKEDRVIDLEKDPKNPQLHISSTFIKFSALGDERFKTNLVSSEDTNLINRILIHKQAYGVLKDPSYFYRKRWDESSTTDTHLIKKEYFTDRLKFHFMDLIDYYLERENKVPLFLQYTLAYNLQWMVTPEIPQFDSTEEYEEFNFYFDKVLSYLSVESLSSHRLSKSVSSMNYLISRYNHDMHVKFDVDNNEVYMKTKNRVLDRLGNHKLWIDVLEFKGNRLNISGSLNSMFDVDNVAIKAVKKDKNGNINIFTAKRVEYFDRADIRFFSETIQYKHNFDISVPIGKNGPHEIKLKVMYYKKGKNKKYDEKNVISIFLPIDFRKHAPISDYCNYFIKDSKIIIFNDNAFEIFDYSYSKMLKVERSIFKKMWNDKPKDYIHSSLFKLLFLASYPIVKSANHKEIYLFIDRIDKADDNAEHLFRYASKQDDNVKKYYTISDECEDYPRMNDEFKNVVKFGSFKHKMLFLFSDKILCSSPENHNVNPFFTDRGFKFFKNSVSIPKYYIRHGVAHGHMSSWLRKFDKNVDLLLTSSVYERKSFLEPGYNYDKKRVKALGLPRFDNLKSNRVKKVILIAPTWRNYLKSNKQLFMNSDYFRCLNALLSDPELPAMAEMYGYRIIFKGHPNLEKPVGDSGERFIDLFDINENIEILVNEPYQELFNLSAMMITDFSSVFFDFAYLKKPVIYYQPNNDHAFNGGYYDYDTMGFGPVTKNVEDLKAMVDFYLDRDCVMEETYKKRVDKFFKYSDKKNCKRVYNWIKKH